MCRPRKGHATNGSRENVEPLAERTAQALSSSFFGTRDELGASDPLAHTDATAPAAPLGSANWTRANGVEHNTLEMFRVVFGWPRLLMTSAVQSQQNAPALSAKAARGNASGQTHGAPCRMKLRPFGRALPLRPSASSPRRPSASMFRESGGRTQGSSQNYHAEIRSGLRRGPGGCGSARGSRTD